VLNRLRFGCVVEDQQPSGIPFEVLADGLNYRRLLGGLVAVEQPQILGQRVEIGAEGLRGLGLRLPGR
jgi:hypothetical protein